MNSQEIRALQEAYMEVVENQQLNEAYKDFPHDKVQAKAAKLKSYSQQNVPIKGKSDKEIDDIGAKQEKAGQRATTLSLASRTSHSEIPKMKSRLNKDRPESKKRSKTVQSQSQKSFGNRLTRSDRQGIRDSYDYYDIILSHLLDEGYAETPEAAEAIMVNMSEDWRESIVEEMLDEGEKPFPYEKVKAKQVALRDKGSAGLDRRMKMGAAVRRAKEAEKTGGSQQDAGKGWYHGR